MQELLSTGVITMPTVVAWTSKLKQIVVTYVACYGWGIAYIRFKETRRDRFRLSDGGPESTGRCQIRGSAVGTAFLRRRAASTISHPSAAGGGSMRGPRCHYGLHSTAYNLCGLPLIVKQRRVMRVMTAWPPLRWSWPTHRSVEQHFVVAWCQKRQLQTTTSLLTNE